MTEEEAKRYAENMTYHEAIYNLKQAKSVPYRKATFIKVNELLNELEREPVIDKIRAEIAEYGSIMVTYAITKDTKTDKGIEKLVSGVLSQAKEQVLEVIDKYKAESEGEE